MCGTDLRRSPLLLSHPLASCLIETFLLWLFCNLWERRHFNLSEMISCCLYRVYSVQSVHASQNTGTKSHLGRKQRWEKWGLFQNERIQLSDARGAHISQQGRGAGKDQTRAFNIKVIVLLLFFIYDAWLLARPCGALFSQLQQSFYSEDQLALQETTKKLVEEVVLCKVMELVADHLLLGRWSTPTPRSGRPREYFPRIKFSKNSARQVFLALTGLEFFLPNEMDNNWEKPSAGNSPLYCR